MIKLKLIGKRFGRLTVSAEHEQLIGGRISWQCVCDCGGNALVVTYRLTSGQTKSCGCWSKENRVLTNLKHGMSGSRLYRIWNGIRNRVSDEKARNYPRYGGRGIKMDKRWLESFDAFMADMGEPPSDKHSVERINNDGDYEPSNCKWGTSEEQANNTRKNIYLEAFGLRMSIAEWARLVQIGSSTLRHRIAHKWSIEDALSSPVNAKKRSGKAKQFSANPNEVQP